MPFSRSSEPNRRAAWMLMALGMLALGALWSFPQPSRADDAPSFHSSLEVELPFEGVRALEPTVFRFTGTTPLDPDREGRLYVFMLPADAPGCVEDPKDMDTRQALIAGSKLARGPYSVSYRGIPARLPGVYTMCAYVGTWLGFADAQVATSIVVQEPYCSDVTHAITVDQVRMRALSRRARRARGARRLALTGKLEATRDDLAGLRGQSQIVC